MAFLWFSDYDENTPMSTTLNLKKYGTFLSGRSLPDEIIFDNLKPDSSTPIVLDFYSIVASNQSFLNQLLLNLQSLGFNETNIVFKNVSNQELLVRINQQIQLVFDTSPEVGSF